MLPQKIGLVRRQSAGLLEPGARDLSMAALDAATRAVPFDLHVCRLETLDRLSQVRHPGPPAKLPIV